MPAVQSAVITFQTQNGTGIQSISGVVDRDGNAFIPKLIIFQAGDSALNTLAWQDAVNNAFIDDRGVATPTTGSSAAGGTISRFAFRNDSNGVGVRYSLLDYQADTFFGGNFQGYAYVSSMRLGGFDLTFDLQNRGGWYAMATCLGGDDFNVDISAFAQNGLRSCTSTPAVVFCMNTGPVGSGLSVSTAAGDIRGAYGWDTRNSNRGLGGYLISGQDATTGNWGGIRTDVCAGDILNSTTWSSNAAFVSAWGANDITFSGASSPTGLITLIFSGTTLVGTAGTFNQPTSIGHQTIPLGIDPQWIKLICEGYPTNATPGSVKTDHSVGWTNGLHQACYWAAESPGSSADNVIGTRYLGNDALIRSALSNQGSTVFSAVASLSSVNRSSGSLILNWTAVDSTPRQVIWLALGSSASNVVGLGEGIYKLVKDKKQDTLWFDVEDNSKILRKIPDPNAFTALVGDE